MNDMVERVARTLFNHSEQSSDQWGWDQHPPRNWDGDDIEECERAAYREDAIAAIDAMYDPTEAMLEAAPYCDNEYGAFAPEKPAATWRAMIDAALKGTGTSEDD